MHHNMNKPRNEKIRGKIRHGRKKKKKKEQEQNQEQRENKLEKNIFFNPKHLRRTSYNL